MGMLQVSLASELQRMFPGITVPDLYQHTSLAALVGAWDAANPSADQAVPSVHLRTAESGKGAAAMILGVGMELPPDIRDEKGLWDALVREQIAIDASRGAGYLTSFDYKQAGLALGVSKVELEVIDPQHVLALAIVDRMWKDLDAGLRARVRCPALQMQEAEELLINSPCVDCHRCCPTGLVLAFTWGCGRPQNSQPPSLLTRSSAALSQPLLRASPTRMISRAQR